MSIQQDTLARMDFTPQKDCRLRILICFGRYFCNPNFDAFIEALPGTYKTEAEKKYPGVNSGEYLVQRLASTYV